MSRGSRRHEDRDTLIVRMFTDSDAPHETTLRLGPEVGAAWRTDLLERRQHELPVTDAMASRTVALPFHNGLTAGDVDRVVSTLERVVAGLS